DQAVEGAMAAKMRNMGEACTTANRFYVHSDDAEAFSNRFVARMREEVVGFGLRDDVTVGPVIDARSRDKIHALVRDAVSRGAKLVTRGAIIGGDGFFCSPPVLVGVSQKPCMMTEEIFGPVAPICVFETGMLDLNTAVISSPTAPFGGIKQSGLGREGGLEGIDRYLVTQYVGIAEPSVVNQTAECITCVEVRFNQRSEVRHVIVGWENI